MQDKMNFKPFSVDPGYEVPLWQQDGEQERLHGQRLIKSGQGPKSENWP